MFERKLERDQVRRSTIPFTRVTQPMLKVERGCSASPKGDSTATLQVLRKAHLADPRGIRAQAPKRVCVRGTLLLRGHDASKRHDEPLATMAGGGFPNRPVGPRATKKARAERSEALSLLVSARRNDESGGERRRISFVGMPAHSVRDASATGAILRSKDLEGGQSPGRIGRRFAGNGGHRYGLICGATPRR